MEWVILWVLFGIASAIVASQKGRSGCAWFLLSGLLGPFGLLYVLLLPKISPTQATGTPQPIQSLPIELTVEDAMKKCPDCGEMIRAEAVKCRYCGKQFDAGEVQKELAAEKARIEEKERAKELRQKERDLALLRKVAKALCLGGVMVSLLVLVDIGVGKLKDWYAAKRQEDTFSAMTGCQHLEEATRWLQQYKQHSPVDFTSKNEVSRHLDAVAPGDPCYQKARDLRADFEHEHSSPTPIGSDVPREKKLIALGKKSLLVPSAKRFTNSLGMKFALIPSGTFMMGSPDSEPGRNANERQHQVTLTRAFYLGVTEVTQRQWKRVMENNPSLFKELGGDCPVETVSWNDVQEFIRRLNQKEGTDRYRLPTAAEWEYACRAGSTTRFSFGDEEGRLGEYAWYGDNSLGRPHRVAQKKANAWGLYDMHGNVAEWCQDWYGECPTGSFTDPQGPPSGSIRVFRGGSWGSYAWACRSAHHIGVFPPDGSEAFFGFRLLRTTD